MFKKFLHVGMFLLIISLYTPAFGDTEPTEINSPGGCRKYEFCSAQTAIGVCTVLPASGDERVLRVASKSIMTFYSVRSIGAHICDFVSSDVGFDDATTSSYQFNAESLTDSNPMLSFSGVFDYVWVTCPTIGVSTTVTGTFCPGNN